MSFSALASAPRSNRWRLVRLSLVCLGEFTIIIPIFAGSGIINGSPSILGWQPGLYVWILSVLLCVSYVALAPRIKSAVVFYTLEYLPSGLFFLGLLTLGLAISAYQLGPNTALLLVGGVVLGLTIVATRVSDKQKWFKVSIERGHLAKSLDHAEATWDTRYDFDEAAADLRALERKGCLVRIVPWIGPAIGMGLADIVGRANAAVLMGVLSLALGFGGLTRLSVDAAARCLELRRLEKVLGRPIILAEDVAAKRA